MKKNIVSVLLGAAVITLFAGCAKEQTAGIESPSAQVFKAYIESPATRTALERTSFGGKILWNDGDIITVNGAHYKAATSEDKTYATFTTSETPAVPDASGKFVATYPYNLAQGDKLVLNDAQLYDGTTLAKVYPMYAVTASEDEPFAFKNICGLFEIILKGTAKISTITISDDEKAMCGAFTVDADFNAVISDHSSKAGVKLQCNGAQLTEEGVAFYISVPAETYNSLTISATSLDGIKWTVKAKKPATVQRSMIYSLEFTPELGSGVHEKVQLWENGPYWATTNIGAAKPEDTGLFFSWGNTDGYLWNGTTLEGAMSGYQFVEDPWYNWTAGGNIDEGDTSNPTVLNASQDAASVIWGDGWRMPTSAEATEFGKLDSEYDEDAQVLRVYSNVDPAKSIAIPCKGYFGGATYTANNWSGLWTATCRGKNTQAYIILCRPDGKFPNNAQKRWCGFNIRPVCDK